MASRATKLAPYAKESFTQPEASAKVGRTVRLLADRNHIQKGAIGDVVDFHETSRGDFEVVVRWNSPNGSEPFHDRVSKSKYQLLIAEK